MGLHGSGSLAQPIRCPCAIYMEVPGLVSDADGDELKTREDRRHRYQRDWRQLRREEKSSRKERSQEDRDRCLGMIAEVVDGHRQDRAQCDLARA